MSQPSFPKPNYDWRPQLDAKLRAICPELAVSLQIHFRKGGAVRTGFKALRELSENDRLAVWQTIFPALADAVELAWKHLDPQVMARRDGGEEGYGTHFTFAPRANQVEMSFITWLRKLRLIAGPYPEASLDLILAHLDRFYGKDYDKETGHTFDSDAPGYLASVVLTHEPESSLAIRMADQLESDLLGKTTRRHNRTAATAVFCADRPDLWQRIQQHLPTAGKEPAFLELLAHVPKGAQPGAVLNHLRIIRDHELLRFEAVADAVRRYFGIDWQWKSHHRDDLQPWFEQWLAKLEAKPGQIMDLPENPGECLLALWAEAFHDGDSALARIAEPSSLATDSRIAAAHFLGLCPSENRQLIAYRYAVDPDLRVANIAAPLVISYRNRLLEPSERREYFPIFRDFLLGLPAMPDLLPCPAPLPSPPKPDFSNIDRFLALEFPDGAEQEMEDLLPKLSARARRSVVSRLNRYRMSEFDRGMEEITYGSDDGEWIRWQADHDGVQSEAQKQLLLKLINDRTVEVAEAAGNAVQGLQISETDIALLLPVLKGKSSTKRLVVTRLLAGQSEPMLRKILPGLLAGKTAGERVAALEVFRLLREQENTSSWSGDLLLHSGYRPGSAEETRAFEVLNAPPPAASNDQAPGLDNAFGLVDPKSLAQPVEPQEHEVTVHSPVTLRLIESLDQWAQERADVPIRSPHDSNPDAMIRLADADIPIAHPRRDESREDTISRFTLAAELTDWWNLRPAELRDPDGFECVRLAFAFDKLLPSTYPGQAIVRKCFFGCDKAPVPKSPLSLLRKLFSWVIFLVPDAMKVDGQVDYLIDSAEMVYRQLPDDAKGWAGDWSWRLRSFLAARENFQRASMERLWSVIRNRPSDQAVILRPELWEVTTLLREGIATEDELIWYLVGPRPFGKYDQERAFRDLENATGQDRNHKWYLESPACERAIRRVVDRIIELELTRGEEPQVWTHAALRVSLVRGARNLQRLLMALGKEPLRRPVTSSTGDSALTRNAVLIRLIHVSRPDNDDTPESFAGMMREAGIPTNRLLEISMMCPAWTPFVAHATGIGGLRDAVGWIYAHTRSSDYQWEKKAKDLWAGELGFDSPLSAEEFIEGAVDADWFERVYAAVGPEVWGRLDAAAKFASTSNGHTRARMFADALLGKTEVKELEELLFVKGNLNAARALGLPALAKGDSARRADLLWRYAILQKLRLQARASKAQRRASEINAYEIGVRNLARRAGYSDTVRFEWAMECEAVAGLSKASLAVMIADLQCNVIIRPDGTLTMEARRNGKALASIPATTRKHDDYKLLKERMDDLKDQASRLRPSFETMMVHGVALPVSEWRKILSHPLAGPLLHRLLLADPAGTLGFPTPQGLIQADGRCQDWPTDDADLHLAHPTELLPAESWLAWQRYVFEHQIIQPFKQIFREVYLPLASETIAPFARSDRFAGSPVRNHQALAILNQRGWIRHPNYGLYRVFRSEGLCAWLALDGDWDSHQATLGELYFTRFGRNASSIAPADLPPRIFSEAMRDIDLIASVAHASGAVPEAGQSSIELRATLIRETCRMLDMKQVDIDGNHAVVHGTLGTYRVHLGSGVVHREPGGMLAMKSDPQHERGRIFLPFADDDPQGITVLSRVLLLANDDSIRDPALATALRQMPISSSS